MKFTKTDIPGCFLIELSAFRDERGWFSRLFCQDTFLKEGIDFQVRQINQSMNKERHTFRGMHMQRPPFSEGKIVRCVSGAVQDFVLDLRLGSPTLLKTSSFHLSENDEKLLYIPKGVAHGFLTLEESSSLTYLHDTNYAPEAEFGVRFDDPAIDLILPYAIRNISEKDVSYPLLSDFKGFKI